MPVFEEQARFGDYGEQLVAFIRTQAAGSHLVFVDDGSDDGTAALVEALLEKHDDAPVRLLRRPHLGKGAAVAAGVLTLHCDDVAFCDLDLSTPLEDLQRVIDVAGAAQVLAIGSRDLSGSTLVRRESRLRETLGRSYNRLLQATVTPGVVDTQCGAKAASREVWDRLLPHCRQQGFAWDAELVAVALASGVGVREVPIAWRHDDRSKIRVGRDGLAMVTETGRIWASARRAAASASAVTPAAGVFEGQHAEELIDADRTHWWFRSKAALVATALVRTGGASGFLADVGAGAGGVTAMLGWEVDRVVVLEAGETLVHHARHGNGMPALRSAVAPLPLADSSVDVVCLLDVIEHLPDPADALAEAGRILRPDGRLVINVPAHAWLWSSADVHLGHHRRYDRRLLRRHLAGAGFEPVLVSHVFAWLVPPVWVERRFRGGGEPALGLDRSGFLIDRAAMVLTTVERLLLGRVSVPVGTSLLCVAVRPTRPPSPRGTPLPR